MKPRKSSWFILKLLQAPFPLSVPVLILVGDTLCLVYLRFRAQPQRQVDVVSEGKSLGQIKYSKSRTETVGGGRRRLNERLKNGGNEGGVGEEVGGGGGR